MKDFDELKKLLDKKVELYNRPSFIAGDPISIPHRFSKKQDIEISAFFAATLAWGQRTTIINSTNRLISLMDDAPHDFILHHEEKDLKKFLGFKHRTFNDVDLLHFVSFLKLHYSKHRSLEKAFFQTEATSHSVESALTNFHNYFFEQENSPKRTAKHVSTPIRKSTCKRLNMFLRWMVRKDENGVDFGIWNSIKPSQLLIPLDVHVNRVVRQLKLVKRKQTDWLTVIELTDNLKKFDPTDPVKYDFALFGMGVMEK